MLPLAALPQASLDSVIATVRMANPSLIASRLQMEAEIKAARTGISLPNPEVQFDYLWGDPASSGNRIDFGVSQSFSFPSVYVQKSNQSGLVKTNASLSYLQKEREVIHQAKLVWIGLVGINKRLMLIEHRRSLAGEIAGKAKIQLSRGEIDIIRYHHAQIEFVNLKMEKTRLDIERNSFQTRLIQLCGGKTVPVPDTAYPAISTWSAGDLVGSLAGTPGVKSLENEINIRNLDKNIAVSEWFPKFKAGYYSENIPGLRYQGITTGISIPLFQNSNTVKTADLRMKTATAELDQFRSQRIAVISSLLNKRDKLSTQVQEIRSALLPVNDLSLLKKALDTGEINISEFYYECSVFYGAWFNLISSEQELAVTETELLFEAGK
jgi:outer membrane protein TolC